MNKPHISVLKEEAIEGLDIKSDGIYLDMTLGYGGHACEILKRLTTGRLIAFDKDCDAIKYSMKELKQISNKFLLFNKSFKDFKEVLNELNIEKVDGFLFDLGVSSKELDDVSRGFSYMHDARLDMRMDQFGDLDAYKVVNEYSEEDLVRIFRLYGEERHALRIAKNIIKAREIKPIETTFSLVQIISDSYPYKDKRVGHPAKKVFQAIRIEVNNELNEFKDTLESCLDYLNINGRVAVISFHSLEDRICKNIFKDKTEIDSVIKGLPNVDPSLLPDFILVTKKPIAPTLSEIDVNKRAKSAKLRIIKRIK